MMPAAEVPVLRTGWAVVAIDDDGTQRVESYALTRWGARHRAATLDGIRSAMRWHGYRFEAQRVAKP